MQYLREWLACLTLCSAACTLVYILVPSGAMEKTMKTVISLFIIAAIATPLTGIVKGSVNLDYSENDYAYDYSQQVNDVFISTSEQAVKQKILDAVPELDNGVSEVDVRVTIDGENTVDVEYIHIRLNSEGLNAEKIKSEIYEKLQLTAEVTQ